MKVHQRRLFEERSSKYPAVMPVTPTILLAVLLLHLAPYKTAVQASAWNVSSCSSANQRCINRTYRTCETMCDENKTCEIRIGILLPTNTSYIVNMEKALENMQEAEEAARNMGLFPPNTIIKYYKYDDQCNQEYATLGALYSYTEACIHVMFGLICDYCLASAGRIVKFLGNYGTPLITPGGFVFDFTQQKISCTDEYYMILNSGMVDYRSLSEFFLFIMQKYGWASIALLYLKSNQNEVAGSESCYLLAKSVINELSQIERLAYLDGDLELNSVGYKEFLRERVGVRYGIISICGDYQNVREILIAAEEIGMMDKGEYIFFSFELYNNAPIPSQPWYDPSDTNERNQKAKKAYKSTFILTPSIEANYAEMNSTVDGDRGKIFLDGVYDGMMLYSNALNKLIKTDEDGYARPNQTIKGTDVVSTAFGMQFEGRRENITMNCNGLRVVEYALMQLNNSNMIHSVAYYQTRTKTVQYVKNITWVAGNAPSDIPTCGYDNSKCPSEVNIVLIVVCVTSGVALIILSTFLYRHYKLEAEIASMTWKIHWEDIVWLPNTRGRGSYHSTESLAKRLSIGTFQSEIEGLSLAGDRQIYVPIAFYKGIRVAVKKLQDNKIELNRSQLLELKVMKDLSNDHLVKFYGACLDSPHCCILTEYCPRGSLEDILENEKVKLDWLFRMSLIQDITRGMHYLHSSDIKSHGSLKSSNCVVDSRFTLKITDFGLHFLRSYAHDDFTDDENSYSYWQSESSIVVILMTVVDGTGVT
ncbi:atrial natriuretic peptide receptor 1-like isoform X2 [Agrilus planipennis]|uniref:guanylate cyclase n=1 Tax=Agrilus planipennis TaxID=224129 RepID=A0A1W4WJN3_AGRPL|nr:atrial natriuretic peptide receptor 1-like isoform X2 [Agrilus planipennis]